MTTNTLYHLYFFFFLLFAAACNDSEKKTAIAEQASTIEETSPIKSAGVDTKVVSSEAIGSETIPEPSAEVKAIIEEQAKTSIFQNLGCCKEEAKRIKDACCCTKVLEKYKELRASNDIRIANIKQTDPIFNDCKTMKSFKGDIEFIDNPEGEEELF